MRSKTKNSALFGSSGFALKEIHGHGLAEIRYPTKPKGSIRNTNRHIPFYYSPDRKAMTNRYGILEMILKRLIEQIPGQTIAWQLVRKSLCRQHIQGKFLAKSRGSRPAHSYTRTNFVSNQAQSPAGRRAGLVQSVCWLEQKELQKRS